MIVYKIVPHGSEKWLPKDWEKWYKDFDQSIDEIPGVIGKLMHKALEAARRVIITKYLTKVSSGKSYQSGPEKGQIVPDKSGVLHVRTGRLRSSVNYKILKVRKRSVIGQIGTDVWYGKLHEEGGTFTGPAGKTKVFPQRKWLEPALMDPETIEIINKIFGKAGLHLQKAGK